MSYKDGVNGVEIVEENNYYPFGLKHKGYNNVVTGRDHKYGFGGKEEQDELGLDWIDITARNYDPALGRWMNLDPLAEMMRRHSPYNYAFDNPIFFTDPDGMYPMSPVAMKSTATEVYDYTTGDVREALKSGGGKDSKTTDYQAKFEQIGEDLANMDTSLDGGEGNCCPISIPIDADATSFSEDVGLSDMGQSGGSWSNNVDWGGVTDASLGIIGGAFEVAVGLAGEVFTGGLSTALVIDGVYRIGTNAFRLGAYLTDNANVGNALPNNLGSYVGKFIDLANGSGFYDVGIVQSSLGLTNDLLLIASPGGNAGAIRSIIANRTLINSVGLGASYYSGTKGLYNNGKALGAAYGR